MTLHLPRLVNKTILLFACGWFAASCSQQAPAPTPAPAAPPAVAPPALPVLGALPDLNLSSSTGTKITTAALLGKPVLFWFHHPVTSASTEQGKALANIDPSGLVRKIVLVPMPEAIAPFPAMTPPFPAEITSCPPATREALGNLRAIPTVLLVDASGQIRLRQEGVLDAAAITAAIQTLTATK
jgi:hypothetical protein